MHWKRTIGYIAKHGYFADGKKHQTVLPQWARELPVEGKNKVRIKRMERMQNRTKKRNKPLRGDDKPDSMKELKKIMDVFGGEPYMEESGEFEKPDREGHCKTYGEKLDSCGASCFITIYAERFFLVVKVKFPYGEAVKFDGDKEGRRGKEGHP